MWFSFFLAGENRRARNTVPCCCDGSVLCERFSGSVAMDQLDRVRLLAPLRDLHARRTKRHPWEDQAASVRLFFEETLDVRGRNVAFDDVSADLGCVAGALLKIDRASCRERVCKSV